MTEIESKLSAHFTKLPMEPEPESVDEMMKEGEYWEFTEPKALESWSFKMIPHTDNMHFNMKYKNSTAFLPISFDEKIKRLATDVFPDIRIHCVTTALRVATKDQYHVTIVLNSEKINYNITPFLESLEPTPYSAEVKELEESVDRGKYHYKDGTPLTGKRLCTKLGLLMNSFEVFKAKHNMQRSFMASRTVSADQSSQGEGQPSSSKKPSGSQSCGKKNERPPPSPTPTAPTAETTSNPPPSRSSRKKVKKESEESGLDSISYLEEMTLVPEALRTDNKPDYKNVSAMYKQYWETCTSAYIFGVDEKKPLPIERLIAAPSEFNVRVKEDNIVKEMLHYLVNIPDKTTKQTLCVMPIMKKNNKQQPESWDEVKDGQFYIINGQHSVAASKMMMEEGSGVSEEVRNHFRMWNCFIVWSLDVEKLRYISAFYNRVNHFQAIQPSWATNILGAQSVWIAMGRPKHPKGDGTPQSLS